MPEIRATIQIQIDGIDLPDSPIVWRGIVAEAVGLPNLVFPPDNNSTTFHPISQATMAALGIVLLKSDQAANLKLNLNTPLPLNAGGLILICGAALAQGTPNQNVEINNPALTGGPNANVNGALGGS